MRRLVSVKDAQRTVIQGRMPPGTAETLHKHAKSRRVSSVPSGAAMAHGSSADEMAHGSSAGKMALTFRIPS